MLGGIRWVGGVSEWTGKVSVKAHRAIGWFWTRQTSRRWDRVNLMSAPDETLDCDFKRAGETDEPSSISRQLVYSRPEIANLRQ